MSAHVTHVATASHGEDPVAARSNMLLAVKLAILSEIMLFGALFAAYFVIRGASGQWPPASGPDRPELILPGINSLLLIGSSVTMQLAVRAVSRGKGRSSLLRWMGLTLLLGGIFILVQGFEFANNGFGLDAGVFGSTFYILTGFHGAHVLFGLAMIAIVANRARKGLVSTENHTSVEAISYYWHFVDVVWLFLFSTLYVL
ncbi:MAG: cytochrome c oxidase subunit 3 [Chloroflexota bacterium]